MKITFKNTSFVFPGPKNKNKKIKKEELLLDFCWLFYVCQISVSIESCNWDLLGLKYEAYLSCWNFNYLIKQR